MGQLPYTLNNNELSFAVKVMPRASRQGVGEVREGQLVVYLNAPPVDGAANQGLVKLLAKTLKVSPSSVCIVSGHKNRNKVVKVLGITGEQLLAGLQLS